MSDVPVSHRLCRHKDSLGRPGEGLHRYRIGGLAAVDVFLTVGLAFGLSRAGGWPFLAVLAILVIAAVAIHELFCVNTRLNAAIFGREYRPGGDGR